MLAVEAKPVEDRKILLLELLLLMLKQEREIEERLQLEEKVVEEGAQPCLRSSGMKDGTRSTACKH